MLPVYSTMGKEEGMQLLVNCDVTKYKMHAHNIYMPVSMARDKDAFAILEMCLHFAVTGPHSHHFTMPVQYYLLLLTGVLIKGLGSVAQCTQRALVALSHTLEI